jgi:hypothetical protein
MITEFTPNFEEHPEDADALRGLLDSKGPWRTNWMAACKEVLEPVQAIWQLEDQDRLGALKDLTDAFRNKHWDELGEAAIHHEALGTLGYANCPEDKWGEVVGAASVVAVDPAGLWPVESELIKLLHLQDAWATMAEQS